MCIIQNFTLLYPTEISDSHKALHVKLDNSRQKPEGKSLVLLAGFCLRHKHQKVGKAGESASSALAGPTAMAYEVAGFAWHGSCN